MKTIVLDMDGVLADFDGYCQDAWGPPADKTAYGLTTRYPHIDKDRIHGVLEDPNVYAGLREIPCASHAVEYLFQSNRLVVVTGRGDSPEMLGATCDWLKRNYIDDMIEEVISVKFEDKPKVVAALKPDLLIDDSPYQLQQCSNLGVTVLMYEYPYNKHLMYPRISSWLGIEKSGL